MTDDWKPESETPYGETSPPQDDGGEEVSVEGGAAASDVMIAEDSSGADLSAKQETPASEAAADSLWQRVTRSLSGGANRLDNPAFVERIRHLDAAIEAAPLTPANYVLRGELYMSAGEYEQAQADFQRGYELAARQFERSDWGLMAQAMQDRALIGLQKAAKKLSTNHHSP